MKRFLATLVLLMIFGTSAAGAQSGLFLRDLVNPGVSPVTNQTWIFNTATNQIFVWDGTVYKQVSVPFFNVASVNPAPSNDQSQGYQVGSIWLNTFSQVAYIALDVTPANAVWVVLGVPAPPGTTGVPLVSDTAAPGGLAWEDLPPGHISATGSAANDVLVFSGTAWAPTLLPLASIDNGGATDGQVLTWNDIAGAWIPGSAGGGGGVSSFTAGNLAPLFTTSVANPTTNPALSFSLSSAAGNTVFGRFSGGSGAPSFSTLTVAMGGTGLSAIGTADYVLAANHSGSANEYKQIIGTGGITVTGGSGTLTIDGSGAGSGGTVTSFSSGNLSPLFTTSVATSTTTPVLSYALSAVSGFKVYGNFTSGSAAPSFGGPITSQMGGTGTNSTATNGQIPIGSTVGGQYTPGTITAGSGITVTNGAGSITIAATASANTVTLMASENIAAGALINIWNSSGTAKIRNADASTSRAAQGWAPSAITSGNTGTVTIGNGADSSISGLTIGSNYFLDATGGVTTTPPGAGNLLQQVGFASDAAVLQVQLGNATQR
jgi:hypothetical protein